MTIYRLTLPSIQENAPRIRVEEDFYETVLTVAAEGGIGYWAEYDVVRREDLWVEEIYNIADPCNDHPFPVDYVNASRLHETFRRIFDGDIYVNPIFWKRLRTALIDEGGVCALDAEDCDVLIQLAIFGELVYG